MGSDYRSLAMWGALHFNRKRGRIFQASVEVNRLRSFWVILAHFGVKSTPFLSNSNYYKQYAKIVHKIMKKVHFMHFYTLILHKIS